MDTFFLHPFFTRIPPFFHFQTDDTKEKEEKSVKEEKNTTAEATETVDVSSVEASSWLCFCALLLITLYI